MSKEFQNVSVARLLRPRFHRDGHANRSVVRFSDVAVARPVAPSLSNLPSASQKHAGTDTFAGFPRG